MHIIQANIKYSTIIGIGPYEPGQESQFNRRNVGVLLIYGIYFILVTAYLVDAKTFREYAQVLFPWITILFTFIGFLFNVSKTNDTFQFKNNLEKVIESGTFAK